MEKGVRFTAGLALQFEGHQRSGSLTDRTTLPGELEVFDMPIRLKFELEMDFISAGGVVPVDCNGRLVEFSVVPWAFGMVEDYLLIQFFELGIHKSGEI
jgi:hypothetical protein